VRQLLMAGLLAFGAGSYAFGAVDWELELTDGTNTALINSSGTLVLTGSAAGTAIVNATTGVYTYDGSIGNYTVDVTTGAGSSSLPLGALDLNSIDISGPTSGPLTIEWSENGITSADTSWTMGFGGTFTTSTPYSLSNTAYESNTNSFFAQTNTIGTITPTLGTGGSFSGGTSGAVSGVTTPYSLTEVVTLDGTGSTTYSGDATLTPSPEPASVVLLGSVVSGVVIVLRRRKLMKKALVD
jgi:hypothetical protein